MCAIITYLVRSYTYVQQFSIVRVLVVHRTYVQSRACRSRCSAQQTTESEVRGSVSRVKTPCEQGLPHYTYFLQAEQRLPHATEKAKVSFPMERGSTAKHHPAAWNPKCSQRFRAEEFPLLPLP